MLNAGAITFQPDDIDKSVRSIETADKTRDSFNEYKAVVENIDEAMNRDLEQNHNGATPSDINAATTGEQNSSAVVHQSSLPSYMAKHAAEFWFPECRECTCCQGFKHGCKCAASNGGSCTCVAGAPDDVSAMTASTTGNNNNSYQPSRNSGSRDNNDNGGRGRRKVSCRFFFSAAGCRYGDGCTFDHTK